MTGIFDAFYNSGRIIGFDTIFKQLDQLVDPTKVGVKPSWPPYNIIQINSNEYQLQFALAGFSASEITAYQTGSRLVIEGELVTNTKTEYLYKGISTKDFSVEFLLAVDIIVDDIVFDNGMLRVTLLRPLEGNVARKTFDIRNTDGSATKSVGGSESYPRSDLIVELEAAKENNEV